MKFSLVLILHLCVVMIHGVQSYDSHRKHYPKKKGFHHHGGHQSKVNTKSKLLFPSGKSYAVVTPYGSGSSRCPGRPTYVKLTSKSRRWKKEYDIVKNELQKNMKVPAGTTFGGFRVIKIDKVINSCLWQKYKYRKDQVHNEAKTVNEKMLFHAAPHPYTSAKRGLDERYSTLEKGNYGAGLYFSDGSYKAHLSAKGNKDGTKILMLCRVMLGKVQVHTDAAVNKLAHPPVGFQSVAAVNGEVSEYVIYRGEQAYPDYVITYKA